MMQSDLNNHFNIYCVKFVKIMKLIIFSVVNKNWSVVN